MSQLCVYIHLSECMKIRKKISENNLCLSGIVLEWFCALALRFCRFFGAAPMAWARGLQKRVQGTRGEIGSRGIRGACSEKTKLSCEQLQTICKVSNWDVQPRKKTGMSGRKAYGKGAV